MNILMTNIALARPSGSENWTYLVAKKLSEKGHNVNIYTKVEEAFSKNFHFATVLSKPPAGSWKRGEETNEPYDLAIMNHMSCTLNCRRSIVTGPRIRILHGTQSREEAPYDWEFNILAVISDELNDYTKQVYGVQPAAVIPNPVDPTLFNIERSNSNQILWTIHKNNVSIPPIWIHQSLKDKYTMLHHSGMDFPIRNTYEKASVIIGEGRAAYQAMAAGIPIIISNGYTTVGVLTPDNYQEMSYNNCTVRVRSIKSRPLNTDILHDEIDKAFRVMDEELLALRKIAADRHSVDYTVNTLFDIAKIPIAERTCKKEESPAKLEKEDNN